MPTALFTHASGFEHDTGEGHPERIDRLRAVTQAMEVEEFQLLDRRDAPEADRTQLIRVHDAAYVDDVFASIPDSGHRHLDADTVVSPGSGRAALHAAGAVCAAVDAVMAGEVRNAFCAVRPPGHHAEADRAMGFCLFNNIAVGAAQAQAVHGIDRVAVIDFDVHHGNGTQAMFERDASRFYGSIHQFPFYPGTGAAQETGVGNIVNVTMTAMSGTLEVRREADRVLFPALQDFAPELLMISAGFDAHQLDPLGGLNWTDGDYTWLTERLLEIAGKHAENRVVSVLEGGYSLSGLASATAAHVRTLMTA